jgi:hypothetical protein
LERLRRHRRERHRAGLAARRLVYRDAFTIVRRHWYVFLAVFAVPMVVYGIFQSLLYRLAPGSDFARGFGWGLMLGLALLGVTVLLTSFNLEKRLTGTQAEGWSTTELLRLEAHGWRVINDLPTDFGNIDHVVIGEHAVLAVETKVIDDSPWLDQAVDRACIQAGRGADRIRLVLRQHQVTDVRVIPAVLQWGIGVASRPPSRCDRACECSRQLMPPSGATASSRGYRANSPPSRRPTQSSATSPGSATDHRPWLASPHNGEHAGRHRRFSTDPGSLTATRLQAGAAQLPPAR